MKIVIAGDIHGSELYCEKLLSLFDKSGADKLVLMGDLLYHGPRNDLPNGYDPKKTVELLNAYADKILCVRGNCEAEVDQMLLDFPVMADYALVSFGDTQAFVTHGHLFSKAMPPKMSGCQLLINGHTHVPAFDRCNGFVYLNPGSVSIPKESSAHGCIVTDGKTFDFTDLDGVVYRQERL